MNFSRKAQLVILEPNSNLKTYDIVDDQVLIGHAIGMNSLILNSRFVSSQHMVISRQDDSYIISDLASLNGTYVNGTLLKSDNGLPTAPVFIKDGDVISIGEADADKKVFMFFSTNTSDINNEWDIKEIIPGRKLMIGRGSYCDICVPNITVSREHAVIENSNSQMTLTDLNSANGTIVDNNTIYNSVVLQNFAVIRIGTSKIVRIDDAVIFTKARPAKTTGTTYYIPYNDVVKSKGKIKLNANSRATGVKVEYDIARNGGVEVEVDKIYKKVSCKNGTGINGGNQKYILQDISLTIHSGELVAILGGSGAGKTTFMNAINGFEPGTSGGVKINSVDLYKNYQAVKPLIGYVPQQDIVHDNLTVESMLTYVGKLRLPADITKEELGQRVMEVLDMVDLTAQKDTFIKKLSGGQKKRASIAVELVADPALFFLDEPTSGLDPEAETTLMHQLRDLSENKGKTVIVITHTLQNIRLFDKVIFLAPGGKLVYYGSPKDAQKFFEVDNLVDAYEKISDDIDGYCEKFKKEKGGK